VQEFAMNRLTILLLFAMPAALLADDKEKATPTRPAEWTPTEMLKVKSISSVQVSPNGRRVVCAVREAVVEGEKSEYLTHLHVANADGGDAFQLTQGDKSCDNPHWSPDGESIAFTSARSGKNDIWLIRVQGGEAEKLTEVKTGVGGFKWSPDGKHIAYTAADPKSEEEEKKAKQKDDAFVVDADLKMNRLYVVPVAKDAKGKREPRKLTDGNYSVGATFGGAGFDWSPDGKTIAFPHTVTAKVDDWPTSNLSVVEVATAQVKSLVKTNAAESSPLFSPDGKWIAYTASDIPPRWAFSSTVYLISADGGKSRELAETFNRQPQLLGWSADGKRLYLSEARGTMTRLYALPLEGPPEELSKGDGVLAAVSLNQARTHFGFTWQNVRKPQEAYVSSVERFEPRPVSRANADIPDRSLGRTEVVRWKSVDGTDVEGLLTFPVGFEAGRRYPLLLVIHGGPAGVFTQNFTADPSIYPVAAFAAKGYAVLRCNPRGSTGYGKAFRYANQGDWGGGDFQDLMTGVDHVIGMGVADKDRLGVMGWSYGGFMTSWVITQTKRFRAASVGAGVTNLMSFTGTADIPSFLPDYFGGEYWDKFDAYRNHSAMFQVKGVSTPTLIQHGEKDERVPISQGYELYNALKRQGCPVQMVVYPRTPHGPAEPKLLRDVMTRNLEWFDKHLASAGK
jgi:dipeptidyl aminopeptidase/acylaminoacyl peptidase